MKSGTGFTRLIVVLVAIVVILLVGFWLSSGNGEPGMLDVAKRAALWLERTAIHDDSGIGWPMVPQESEQIVDNLYAGSAGPVLFFLELYKATGEERYLQIARSGVDHLSTVISSQQLNGLYVGTAGLALVFLETWRTTGEESYHQALLQALDRRKADAQTMENGITWDESTDIIVGSAGFPLVTVSKDRA